MINVIHIWLCIHINIYLNSVTEWCADWTSSTKDSFPWHCWYSINNSQLGTCLERIWTDVLGSLRPIVHLTSYITWASFCSLSSIFIEPAWEKRPLDKWVKFHHLTLYSISISFFSCPQWLQVRVLEILLTTVILASALLLACAWGVSHICWEILFHSLGTGVFISKVRTFH